MGVCEVLKTESAQSISGGALAGPKVGRRGKSCEMGDKNSGLYFSLCCV